MAQMTGRERFLTILDREKPDRLACQVHSWMDYYRNTYLGGMDQFQAYAHFGMDPVIYTLPILKYDEKDLAKWEVKRTDLGLTPSGDAEWMNTITTPKGVLTERRSCNQYTEWVLEHIIKSEGDFELWKEFYPIPTGADWSPVREAKAKIGDTGIVRGAPYHFGQGSSWQSFAGYLYPVEEAIMATFDNPDWVHYVMNAMTDKQIAGLERIGPIELDLVETGGGAGSSTVISPTLHQDYCLPYDSRLHRALHDGGTKAVYHLCGGLMPLLDLVMQNGADGLETMTPPSMGGDCNLAEASRIVDGRLFFIGGFDQGIGFEKGTPELVRKMVFELFEACPQGTYICSPSDHFFFGEPANIQAFADAVKECVY